MNEVNNSPSCERASDLIAFLYNEADEHEARDFQLHLQRCSICREEVASFDLVRESVTAWRDEALAGFVSRPLATPPATKSALAALRQFFDLSPLWLKGAAALAAVTFCVLAGLVIFKNKNENVSSIPAIPEAVYTQQDVKRLVEEALANQEKNRQSVEPSAKEVVAVNARNPKRKKSAVSNQFAKSRRPLSRAEREQLAADLRLLANPDDASLNLLGDRINQ